MNYYERYCGDYSRDTAHLSLAEHGAYTLMLDAYYSTERALPQEYPPIYRLCRAMNKAEQACVRSVADEFFPICEDGLRHNMRADKDLAKAIPRIAKARENGSHGGRPKKPRNNPAGYETETQQEPSGFPKHNPAETQPGEASPHAIHQKSKTSASRSLPADFKISERVAEWARDKGHQRLAEHLEHFVGTARAKGYKYVDWDEAFMNAIRSNWAHLDESKPAQPAKRQVAL